MQWITVSWKWNVSIFIKCTLLSTAQWQRRFYGVSCGDAVWPCCRETKVSKWVLGYGEMHWFKAAWVFVQLKQCSAVQCSAVQCSAVLWHMTSIQVNGKEDQGARIEQDPVVSSVVYGAMCSIALCLSVLLNRVNYCTTLHCTELHYMTLHCIALYDTALYCSAVHWTALDCSALQFCTLGWAWLSSHLI